MSATLVLDNSLTESLRLGRREVRDGSPSWSFAQYSSRVVTLAPGAQQSLGDADFLHLTCDQPVTVGWTPSGASVPVELGVDSFTVLTGHTPSLYVKNANGVGVPTATVRAVTANK